MRIKPAEIVLSATMIVSSLMSITADYSYFKGFPVYSWVEYIILGAGVLIPFLAWFLRSPSRNKQK